MGFVVCIIRVAEVPSGEGCLLGWRARVPVLDGWLWHPALPAAQLCGS